MSNCWLCKAMLTFFHPALLSVKFGNLMNQRSIIINMQTSVDYSASRFALLCVKKGLNKYFQLQKTLSTGLKSNGTGKKDTVSIEFNGNLTLSGPTALISIQHFLLNPLFASSNAVGLEWPPGCSYLHKNQANVFNKEKITRLLDIIKNS